MKALPALLLLILLCGSTSALAEKLGVSMAYFDQNFLTIIRHAIDKEAQARGLAVQFEDARGDVGRQTDQVQSFISAGVDAIIVDPVDSASTPALTKMARQAKIPLVYVNRTPGDRTLPPGVVFVGSDERESGTLQMEALAKQMNYAGNVAIMIGNLTDAGALQRTKDVEQVVAKYPNMKVVLKQTANYSRNEGMDLMLNWITNGEAIDAVAANNDEMAIGAIMALDQSGKRDKSVLVGGIDATPDGLKALASGKMQVTVFQDAIGQGKASVDAAQRLIKGEKVPSNIWIPFELVTRENMQTYVEKSR
ncbi:sugar ABC transporter substrate-binding protein [Pantoea sp.]|uniref:sugar ABC transporter substrate-binding protein n=1 Tax=Pantoea sp. TaxID=69393 RepID=UPI00289FE569|nr:sugar ABC transporter substrate-binding protein [Pantoea sp.]